MDNKIDDLKLIKRDYGEDMAHLCRELFPTILETPGTLYKILSSTFAKYKGLCEDIKREHKEYKFKEYIYEYYDKPMSEEEKTVTKTVKELLEEAGYDLYECECFDKKGEDDPRISVKQFEKYYAPGEKLCSFRDVSRIDNHHIFFIVKKNVDEIKREDFKHPKRGDLYSTSVLDLQFDKGHFQRVSIKSRYNHTVNNPDATYSNNLDRIAEGLTDAFAKEYGYCFDANSKSDFELRDYVMGRDGRLYKYNLEIDNKHFCPNNYILEDGNLIDTYNQDKSRYILMDQFLLDRQTKTLTNCSDFYDSFEEIHGNIKQTNLKKEVGYTLIELFMDDGSKAEIKINSDNRIIGYTNNDVKKVGGAFLSFSQYLEKINMSNLQKCGDGFLEINNVLESISLSNLQDCGNDFLRGNETIKIVELPSLKKCGTYFLYHNLSVTELKLPKLRSCDNLFLSRNEIIKTVELPYLEKCGDYFLGNNEKIMEISLPNLQKCGSNFLATNANIQSIQLPNLQECGEYFLCSCRITEISLPKLKKCESGFLCYNSKIIKISLPNLQECGSHFIDNSEEIMEISLPNLQKCGNYFIADCYDLTQLSLPKLQECGDCFLKRNKSIKELSLPMLRECGEYFFGYNLNIEQLSLPSLEICAKHFLFQNTILKRLNLPKLRECGNNFLLSNNSLVELNLPDLQKCGNNFLKSDSALTKVNLPSLEQCDWGFLSSSDMIEYFNLPNLNINSPYAERYKRGL